MMECSVTAAIAATGQKRCVPPLPRSSSSVSSQARFPYAATRTAGVWPAFSCVSRSSAAAGTRPPKEGTAMMQKSSLPGVACERKAPDRVLSDKSISTSSVDVFPDSSGAPSLMSHSLTSSPVLFCPSCGTEIDGIKLHLYSPFSSVFLFFSHKSIIGSTCSQKCVSWRRLLLLGSR